MEPDAEQDETLAKIPHDETAEDREPTLEQVLEEFVRPFYAPRDTLHGLPHIQRVVKKARYLARHHAESLDTVVLLHAAYLHGLIYQEETRIRRFLQSRALSPEQIEHIVRAAREAQGEAYGREAHGEEQLRTLEGTVLHDARLLEGGRTFLIASALMLGAARGATLEEILAAVDEQILGRFQCYLPEAQRLYAEKEAFARAFLDDLGPQL